MFNKYDDQLSDGICIVRKSDITRIGIGNAGKEKEVETYRGLHEGEIPTVDLSSLQTVLETLGKYLAAKQTRIRVTGLESLELPLMFMTVWFEKRQTDDHFTGQFYEADDSMIVMFRNSVPIMKIQLGIKSPDIKEIPLPIMQMIDPAIITRVDAMGQTEYAHLFSHVDQMKDLVYEKLRDNPESKE